MEPSHRPGLGPLCAHSLPKCLLQSREGEAGQCPLTHKVRLGRLHSRRIREGQSVIWLHDHRMEGTAWPGAGAVPLWDIHSQVFMETTHRTYVYQASDAAATSRLHLCSPCPGLGGYVCRGTCDATWPVPALLWPEPHCPFPCICWEVDPWEGEVSPPGVLIVGKRMLSAALTSRGGQRRSK